MNTLSAECVSSGDSPVRAFKQWRGAAILRCWKSVFTLLLCCLLLTPLVGQAREVTDMLGRKVQVPDKIERVLGTAPPLSALLMVLAADSMVGLSLPPQPGDQDYLPAGVTQLPHVGSMLGHGRTMSAETVLELKPDVALAWGGEITQASMDNIERQFERIGVPLLFVKVDTLADWPQAFDFVGSLLGREARAKELASGVQTALDKVQAAVAGVPAEHRVRVYYAQGADGLSTECNLSFHVEPIQLAGGYNVHRCKPSSHVGMEKVSLEQVLAWNPDVIIVQDQSFLARLGEDGAWRKVRAVAEGRVLLVPRSPMNWLDRPPSFMRALGIQWLANYFYPRRYPVDMAAVTSDFYQHFYAVRPPAQQLAQWLAAPTLGESTAQAAPAHPGGDMHQHAHH